VKLRQNAPNKVQIETRKKRQLSRYINPLLGRFVQCLGQQ
jgi:hypothetical protein